MAHADPHRAGDPDPHRGSDDVHRPMGLELDALDTADRIAEEERERHAGLPLVFRLIDTVVKSVMVVLLVVLIVAVGVNVFGRFVLNQSLPASAELARFLFIWVIFLGAALAHLHREHIAVTLFVERMPRAVQRWVVVLQELVILVVVVALLLSAREVMAVAPGSSPLLDIPLQLINFSVPFAAALMGLITVYRIAVAVRPSGAKEG